MENLGLKIVNFLKTFFNIVFIIMQLFIIYLTISQLSVIASIGYSIINILAIFLALYIVYAKTAVSFKLTWLFFILVFPISALVFYTLWGNARFSRKDCKKIDAIFNNSKEYLRQDNLLLANIKDKEARQQIELISRLCDFPVWSNTKAQYLELGETMHKTMLKDFKAAKKFIFLEFYIIRSGLMYREIMDVLSVKSKEGVEVRFIYDAGGCFGVIPKSFPQECKENGIACCSFHPLSASLFKFLSFRNHRKICIIDGNICMTGGINIGDEYINLYEKHGHWKDMGIRLNGPAVTSFTLMFLNLWEYITGEHLPTDEYLPTITHNQEEGLVMPYCDSPYNQRNPAANLYMKMIAAAKEYIYIATPYLILDTDLICVLSLAARSGVDIKIITPHIPDKAFVHATTRSFYGELLKEGIQIFEYTPGFIHGKILLTDDYYGVVGSINFDFRSLTWNCECAAWLYNQPCLQEIKEDFLSTLTKSNQIRLEEWENSSFLKKMTQSILRILSPLF